MPTRPHVSAVDGPRLKLGSPHYGRWNRPLRKSCRCTCRRVITALCASVTHRRPVMPRCGYLSETDSCTPVLDVEERVILVDVASIMKYSVSLSASPEEESVEVRLGRSIGTTFFVLLIGRQPTRVLSRAMPSSMSSSGRPGLITLIIKIAVSPATPASVERRSCRIECVCPNACLCVKRRFRTGSLDP